MCSSRSRFVYPKRSDDFCSKNTESDYTTFSVVRTTHDVSSDQNTLESPCVKWRIQLPLDYFTMTNYESLWKVWKCIKQYTLPTKNHHAYCCLDDTGERPGVACRPGAVWFRSTKTIFPAPVTPRLYKYNALSVLERSNMHRCSVWLFASAQTYTGVIGAPWTLELAPVFGPSWALKHAQV